MRRIVLAFICASVFTALGVVPTDATQGVSLTEIEKLNQQVVALYREDKFNEALPLARRAVDLVEKSAGGANASSHVAAYANLGAIYLSKREGSNAAKAYRRAIELYAAQNSEDERLASYYMSLGTAQIFDRSIGEAVASHERALALYERQPKKNQARIGTVLFRLGELVQAQNREAQARDYYGRALKILEAASAPPSKDERQLLESYECSIIKLKPSAAGTNEISLSARLDRLLAAEQGDYPLPPLIRKEPQTDEPGGGVLNGKATKRIIPPYPMQARAGRLAGAILVRVVIDEGGNVVEARAICGGHAVLQQASVEAARGWKFSPTLLSGKPVKVTGVIIFKFTPG